jgi:RNA polymerase sigma-70 factor (ECF subfamily)
MIFQGAIRLARNIEPATDFSPEKFLIECAMQGDQEAFAKLLEPHLRTIFVSALAILNDESDAEDAALDAVLKAFRALAQFPQTAKFSTWLVRIVINEARLRLQRAQRGLPKSLDEGPGRQDEEYVAKDIGRWRHIPRAAMENRELRETLNAALKSLPGEYRVVMALRDIAYLNSRETADVLGLTEDEAKTRLYRARLQIREALASRLWSIE